MEEMKVYWYDFIREDRCGYYEETVGKVDGLEKFGVGNYYDLKFGGDFLGTNHINMSSFDNGFNGRFCSFKKLNKREIEKLGKMVWKR